jgi:uncharacterized protein (TIGR02145 family)
MPSDSLSVSILANPKEAGITRDTLLIISNDMWASVIQLPVQINSKPRADTIMDIRDHQVYKTIKLGSQWWLQRNLDFDLNKQCYKGIPENCSIYGGLYSWANTMNNGPSDTGNPGHSQGICPTGWRVPSAGEWEELLGFVQDHSPEDQSVTALKSKEHWITNPGSDYFDFSALPAGFAPFYFGVGDVALFVTSSKNNQNYPFLVGISDESIGVDASQYYNGFYASVRCICDTNQKSYLQCSDQNLKNVSSFNFAYTGGNTPLKQTFTLSNIAVSRTLNIQQIYSPNKAFTVNVQNAVLSPGDSIHVVLTLNPAIHSPFDKYIAIQSDDPYRPLMKIPIFVSTNNDNPDVSLSSDTVVCLGDIPVGYLISDKQYQNVSIYPRFSTDGLNWNKATVEGDTTSIPNSDYQGSLVWRSRQDLSLNEYHHVWFSLWPNDGDPYNLGTSDTLVFQKILAYSPLNIGRDTILCDKKSLNLSGKSGFKSYHWNTGSSNREIQVNTSGSYILTITDENGCKNADTVNVEFKKPFSEEGICIVSVSRTGRNMVVWEKTPDKGIAGYRIYREMVGEYKNIALVPYEHLSVFLDTAAEADPRIRPYKYKISVIDTCGNESSPGLYHKTIFLSSSNDPTFGGVLLNWKPYEYEGGSFTFSKLYIYRGTSADNLQVIDSIGPGEDVYRDIHPLGKKAYYLLGGVKEGGCYPTGNLKTGSEYEIVYSNVSSNEETSIGELARPDFYIYPNPFSHQTHIRLNSPLKSPCELAVMDVSGNIVFLKSNVTENEFILNLENLQPGTYLLRITGSEFIRFGKLILLE